MENISFSSFHAASQADAVKYFGGFGWDMDIRPGERGDLEFTIKMCQIGSSTVSLNASRTGWGYDARSDADGILFTIPQSGIVICDSPENRIAAKVGAVSFVDHRELSFTSCLKNTSHVSIYLSQQDLLRYIALLNGQPPVCRVAFSKMATGEWAASFMTKLTESIMAVASNNLSPETKLLTHLKESLICFALYNIENNYSKDIRSTKSIIAPTPYCIKRAAEYIQINYSDQLVISDIAAFAGISIRSLQLGFRQFKGITPIAYLREIRLKKANAMLTDSNSSLTPKEVAAVCGFNNYYLFQRYYSLQFKERPLDTARRFAVI